LFEKNHHKHRSNFDNSFLDLASYAASLRALALAGSSFPAF
jgi:hypothetical protein